MNKIDFIKLIIYFIKIIFELCNFYCKNLFSIPRMVILLDQHQNWLLFLYDFDQSLLYLQSTHVADSTKQNELIEMDESSVASSWDKSYDGTLCACVNYILDHVTDVDTYVLKFNIEGFLGARIKIFYIFCYI